MSPTNGLEVRERPPRRHLRPFGDLASMMDQAFGAFRPTTEERGARFTDHWTPKVDVVEREGKLVVKADLPGVKQEDIEIALDDQTLTITARRVEEREWEDERYHHIEREVGELYRALRLPAGIDANTIEATYEAGVLELTIPLPQEEQAKKVPIKIK